MSEQAKALGVVAAWAMNLVECPACGRHTAPASFRVAELGVIEDGMLNYRPRRICQWLACPGVPTPESEPS